MADVKGKRVFLSGPVTGVPGHNIAAFVEAHEALVDAGADFVWDPAVEFIRDGGGHSHEWYMVRCVHELTRHKDSIKTIFGTSQVGHGFDLLVSLPGWQGSEGAALERAVAEACGIRCAELSEVAG